jgi:hypothetical protein
MDIPGMLIANRGVDVCQIALHKWSRFVAGKNQHG